MSRPDFGRLAPGLWAAALGASLFLSLSLAGCSAPEDPAALRNAAIARGDALGSQREFSQAAAAYQDALRVDPRDGETTLKLALALRESEQWSEAIKLSLRAADLLPDNREAQRIAVWALLEGQQFADALERANALVAADPNDVAALLLLGAAKANLTEYNRGVWEFERAWREGRSHRSVLLHMRPPTSEAEDRDAEDAFQKARSLQPQSREPIIALTSLYWASGRLADGAALLRTIVDGQPDGFLTRSLALCYEALGRYQEAERYLRLSAAGRPDSMRALAEFLVRRDKAAEALSLLDTLTAGDQPDVSLSLLAAGIQLDLGQIDAAMSRLDRVLERDGRNTEALTLKAQALLARHNLPEALATARRAADLDVTSQPARLALSRALKASGAREEAFAAYSETWRMNTTDAAVARETADLALMLGRDDVALDLARQAARLAPGDGPATVVLARALVRSGQFSAAERELAPMLAKDAKAADTAPILAVRAGIQAGLGRADSARGLYQRALDRQPDFLEALAGLVGLALKDGQVARAKALVQPVAARHGNDPDYLMLSARVSWADGDSSSAETTLRKVLDLSNTREDAVVLLATVLTGRGQQGEAERVLESALAKRPDSYPVHIALAEILESAGRSADARAQYEEIVAIHPDAFVVKARLAAIYADLADSLDEALRLAEDAKQGLPDDPSVTDTLGWIYVQKHLPSVGLPLLQDAVRVRPANPTFRYHLGVAYERTGDLANARDELSRALAIDQNFRGAEAARALLKTIGR